MMKGKNRVKMKNSSGLHAQILSDPFKMFYAVGGVGILGDCMDSASQLTLPRILRL